MTDVSSSDLKTILHSKRANLYYLEHCRVLVNGGRVEYVTEEGQRQLYWNIPIANTTLLLLGTGTSITQAAMRELARAGVMVGFCGGGGTPLFSGTSAEIAVEWLVPQSEYRPTEYLQYWARFWFDENNRLEAAKDLQRSRIEHIRKIWHSRYLSDNDFSLSAETLEHLLGSALSQIGAADNVTSLLTAEARLTKSLFHFVATAVGYRDFTRAKRGQSSDPANRFLDYGNYLAYGLGAVATWVLGLPHGLAVLHGKTRRGGLVFDTADLIKDAVILPQAFLSTVAGHEDQEFRQRCIEAFAETESLDLMIDTLKAIAEKWGNPP